MTTDALPAGSITHDRWPWLTQRRAVILVLLAVSFILRSGDFFNPLPGDDEQYYVLVAQRLLEGGLPYVDIWDRKPFGLFALLAAIMSPGGNPLLLTALAATFAAAGTAYLVTKIASREVDGLPALGAGVFYLAMLELLAGDTIQTAVFYNFLVVGAVYVLLDARFSLEGKTDRLRIAGAMLLLGLALTIKTIAIFEAAAIGLWVVFGIGRARGIASALGLAFACALVGIAPTALIGIGFAAHGAFDAWWFANFVSQLHKSEGFGPESLSRMLWMMPGVLALAVPGLLGWRRARSEHRALMTAWFAATFIQVFAIGNFWPMYALPLAVPCAIMAAHLFARARIGRTIFIVLCLWPACKALVLDRIGASMNRQTVAEVMATIPGGARQTCLLAYNAPEIFYLLSRSCLVSPYLFVDQFRSSAEAKALPVEASEGLRAALAKRPGTILTIDNVRWPQPNHANDLIMQRALAGDYRRVAVTPWRTSIFDEKIVTWRRNDMPAR